MVISPQFTSAVIDAVTVLSAIAVADFVIAVAAAIRDGRFSLALVGNWVQTHLLGRVLPIAALYALGQDNQALWAIAVGAGATYAAQTLASIRASLGVPQDAEAV